ncbi:MAG: cyclodeaminase/cyclohydrolase family protein [Synergistota bacterium]|nr:cyclodeaminase/cyclohydrolase family protein [Synergistota bacterium]
MKLAELTVEGFTNELASESPAPGGGSAAALAACLGASLASMVASLTVGKEKHRENWAAMEKTREEANHLRSRLLELMEEDTRAFNAFMAALRMPKDTDKQKAERSGAIQQATREAIDVPLETLKRCSDVVRLAAEACEKGNPNAVTDAGTAAALARAAAVSAAYNVRINLAGLKDTETATRLAEEVSAITASVEKGSGDVELAVEKRL